MRRTRLAASLLIVLGVVPGVGPARADTVICYSITGLPIIITVPGAYCLTGNLSTDMTSGAAITIQSSNVVLDLNGFKLGGLASGPDTAAVGISSTGGQNITIKNGTVRGFLYGLAMGSSGVVVEDIRAEHNTSRGIFVQGNFAIIRNNQVVATGSQTSSGSDSVAYGILVVGPYAQVLNNDVINTVKQGNGTAWGIVLSGFVGGASNDFVVNNRITGADVGIEFINTEGKYRDNLTFGVTTPFIPGLAVDAGNNN